MILVKGSLGLLSHLRVFLTAQQQLLMAENRNSLVEGRLHIDSGAL